MKTDALKKAARMKSDECLSRTLAAIDRLKRKGIAVTFASVGAEAHVSRSYLYGNVYLREMITQSRMAQSSDSAASDLNRLIDMQKIEIQRLTRELARLQKIEEKAKRLQEENRELKEQLKTAYTY